MTTTINKQTTGQFTDTDSQTKLEYGRVYAVQNGKYSVTTMDESWCLSLAASCMLVPVVGDTVLFTVLHQPAESITNNDMTDFDEQSVPVIEGYILSVLQRADEDTAAEINLPNNATAKLNTLSLQADVLHTQGQNNVSIWQEQTAITANYQQFSKHINIQANNRNTNIYRHDELKANSQRIVIARDWRVRAQDTDIRAQRQASIDGKRVRLG